ncbi:MAG: hypothetical protein BGO78_11965 [Chloroflexi bacterium 44-23]|nr:MAG: hypothetical protein BGO78_11965 [Chloroflexi bacterium 44-23]
MTASDVFRKELAALLKGNHAHMGFKAVDNFPALHFNTLIPNMPYTFWHLLEHIRRTQRDIIDFIIRPDYQEMRWPQDYWPAVDEQATVEIWHTTVIAIQTDLNTLEAMVEDEKIDLAAELPYAPGYTYLREVLLVADHNAYHLGEFAIVRGILGLWNQDDGNNYEK